MTGTLYVLVKPDGTCSSPAEYSAISRLAGHLGGTIEPVPMGRPAPDFDPRIDYPERYADGRPI